MSTTPAVKNKTLVQSSTFTQALAGKENSITAGAQGQYFRGDKTWQTLNKTAVGLGNVDNTADTNKPVSTPQSNHIENEISKSFPVGAKGMVPFIRDDNSRTAEMSRILKTGEFIETDTELADSKTRITSMATVFNEWTRFSHDTTANQPANATEINNWSYDAATDTISCTVNSNTHIGFVSKNKYDKYLHEVRLTSTDGDDDTIGVVVAFAVDSNGKQHTLTALRSTGGNGFTWRLVYNYNRSDAKVIQDKTSVIKWGNGTYGATAAAAAYTTNQALGGWDDFGTVGTKVKIERDGDSIKAITTDLGSEAYVASSEISFSLTSDPVLAIFRGPAAYGFSALSQNAASYKVLSFSEATNIIYDLRTNTAYTYVNGAWVVDATKSLYNDVGVGRLLYNVNSGKVYFMESDGPKKIIDQAVFGKTGPKGDTGPAGPATYDFHNFINGKPLAQEIIMRAIACRAMVIPANCAGSYAFCSIAATVSFEIELLKNGVKVGSVTFAPNQTSGTFTMATQLTLNPGDQFTMRCVPATQDATLSDLTFAIKGDTV